MSLKSMKTIERRQLFQSRRMFAPPPPDPEVVYVSEDSVQIVLFLFVCLLVVVANANTLSVPPRCSELL